MYLFIVKRRGLVRTCEILFVVMIAFGTSAVEVEETISVNKAVVEHPGWVRFSTEYVRCFCNFPSCVATGYMCKSSAGGCFSDLLDQDALAVSSRDYRGIHGCVELLTDRDQKKWCQNNPNNPTRPTYRKKNHPKSLLLCCYHDMCNHADSPATKTLLNDTNVLGEIGDDNRLLDNVGSKQDPVLYTESEVWFRAATIAVPICGAVILLALIVLAIKLLKTESTRSSAAKLGTSSYMLSTDRKINSHHSFIAKQPHHHNPLYPNDSEDTNIQSYLPLLIQTEIRGSSDSKNETNAKLNLMQDFEHTFVKQRCDNDGTTSPPDYYKNNDVLMGRNIILSGNSLQHNNDNLLKVYDKEVI